MGQTQNPCWASTLPIEPYIQALGLYIISSPHVSSGQVGVVAERGFVENCYLFNWKGREIGKAYASIQGHEWVESVLENPRNVFGSVFWDSK